LICGYPKYHEKYGAIGCGKCMACRVNRKKEWTLKMLLEATTSKHSSFLTVTYEDGKTPKNTQGDLTLRKKDLQKYIKRLRHEIGKLRYFAVGEYGDEFGRPHYHAILFTDVWNPMNFREMVNSCWGQGFTYLGECTVKSIKYVAGYTTKKMVDERKDPLYTDIEAPFATMSLKPAIGAKGIEEFSESQISRYVGYKGDVPQTVKVGDSLYPVDKHLRQIMRARVGVPLEAKLRPKEAPRVVEFEEVLATRQKIQKWNHLNKRGKRYGS